MISRARGVLPYALRCVEFARTHSRCACSTYVSSKSYYCKNSCLRPRNTTVKILNENLPQQLKIVRWCHSKIPEEESSDTSLSEDASITSTVEQAVRATHIPDNLVNYANLRVVVSYLYGLGANANELIKVFSQQPTVSSTALFHWDRITPVLFQYGFSISQILDAVAIVPKVIRLSDKRIAAVIDMLQSKGIASTKLASLLSSSHAHAQLLLLEPHLLNDRLQYLDTLFPRKDIVSLVLHCPEAMAESLAQLEMKVQYLMFQMGLNQQQIVQSSALSHSLQDIICRFEVMRRGGLFTVLKPKANRPNVISNNPKMNNILNTDDTHFAHQLANISVEEYSVFCKMVEGNPQFFQLMDVLDEDAGDEDKDEISDLGYQKNSE